MIIIDTFNNLVQMWKESTVEGLNTDLSGDLSDTVESINYCMQYKTITGCQNSSNVGYLVIDLCYASYWLPSIP